MIKIADPIIKQEEINAVVNTLKSGQIASGTNVKRFENAWSTYVAPGKHSIAVNSGTSALHAALWALGIQQNQEVIVPAFSFYSTASVVSLCGATPVFCDVDKTGNLTSVAAIENKINRGTGAIIITNLYGRLVSTIAEIEKLAKDYGIPLVVDSCQMPCIDGAAYGDIACFSLYATKNITTGEGGMITTQYADIEKHLRELINHGQSEKYVHSIFGSNFRMTDIAAAMGIEQLHRLNAINIRRQQISNIYDKEIHQSFLMKCEPSVPNVYHQYVILSESRNRLIEHLTANGIETAVHYPTPIPLQPLYRKAYRHIIPEIKNSMWLSKRVLSIPCHPNVSDEDAHYIAERINETYTEITCELE